MKHVAMVIPTIDQIGGAERQVLLLAKGLAARGWPVTVIALSGTGGSAAGDLSRAGVDFLSLGMRKAWVDPRGWLRYREWFLHNRPDIVHAHLPHAAWFARWARLLTPVRVTLDTIHTSRAGSFWKCTGYRISSWLTNHVTCVSHAVASSVLASGIENRSGLSILPNGVQVFSQQFPASQRADERSSFPDKRFHWVAVGRLTAVKDYPTLFRAFAQLRGQAQLTIAGNGPEEAALQRLATKMGILYAIQFAGFQQDVPALLSTADGFVLSSLWEGLPMGILEAGAASLPVVATNGPGTREAMIPGKTGLLVPVGNPITLAEAMDEVMAMPETARLKMGEDGKMLVERQFSLEVVLAQWETLYKDLLSLHPEPTRWG